MMSVILVECDVTSPAGVASTLRFSDRAIFPMAPTDPDRPNAVWSDRLIQAPSLRRALFDDLQSLTPSLGAGLMTLANADRGLDVYQAYVWGEVRVWRWIYGEPFASAQRLLVGPASGTPAYGVSSTSASRVQLTMFDYRLELERPLQTKTYGGSNDVDGEIFFDGEENLRGRAVPLAFGDLTAAHIPAPLVNTWVNAYQLHDGPVAMPDESYAIQIFDRGGDAGLEASTDVSGDIETDEEFYYYALYPEPEYEGNPYDPIMVPEEPGGGDPPVLVLPPRWQTWATHGLIKLNAALVGEIAVGFRGDATGGYVQTTGPIVARMLARAGVPSERIGASVAAFAAPAVVGAYVADQTTAREAIAWVAASALMAVLPDRQGVWQAVELAPPSAEPDHLIISDDILALEADEGAPAGAGEFNVGWGRLWTTYRRESLQAALQFTDAEARLSEAYRRVLIEDAAFKARFPAAWRPLKIDTALRSEADAQTLATALKALFGLRPDGQPRRQWRLTLEMTDAVLSVELGATVEVAAPGWGLVDRYILIAEEPLRPRRDQVIWTLWG